MAGHDRVLVAIQNNLLDFRAAEVEHWYRIPVSSQEKWLRRAWPPDWIAFYQTKRFQAQAYAIHYYARVQGLREAARWELLPHQPRDARSERRYYRLDLGPLERLRPPIVSRRARRIVFIPTTWEKFARASEINDLFDDSPLEDRLWAELRRIGVDAERQVFLRLGGQNYALDFAVYCRHGLLNIETDGDTWHADPRRIPLDNLRDNALEVAQWRLLRFNTRQIQEELTTYCLPTILDEVTRLGGLDDGRTIPRALHLADDAPRQLTLFDD